jgi:hypothetical protein
MKKIILLCGLVLMGCLSLNAQVVLAIQIGTGSDDLRGGNDNVNLIVLMKSGSQVRFNNINRSVRWADNTTNNVTQILTSGKIADVAGFRLETTFSGGIGGDNWNLNRFIVNGVVSNVATKMIDVSGNPLYRFTGVQRVGDFLCTSSSGTTTTSSSSTSTTAPAPAVMTKFNPSVHGFKFTNAFTNIFISGVDWTTGGLCGGMSYSALDYYRFNRQIPQQSYMPAEGMPLQSYLYNRQVTSIVSNVDRWAELGINPGGARNREFFNWGLQTGSGQLGKLMSYIDSGDPVVIGLSSCGSGCKGDHQVLAIGYELGRYKGDLGAYIEDLTIFVCDPNHPEAIMKLKPNNAGSYFSYPSESDNPRWRTYFVDTKYTPQAPPVIPLNPKEIIVNFKTGGDDLRGGNDNVNLIIITRLMDPARRASYLTFRFNNVNNGKRWVNNSWQQISRPLPDNYRKEDVTGFRIETTFSGGMGGDNWNLDEIYISTRINGSVEKFIERKGTPLFRFTGDQKSLEIKYP